MHRWISRYGYVASGCVCLNIVSQYHATSILALWVKLLENLMPFTRVVSKYFALLLSIRIFVLIIPSVQTIQKPLCSLHCNFYFTITHFEHGFSGHMHTTTTTNTELDGNRMQILSTYTIIAVQITAFIGLLVLRIRYLVKIITRHKKIEAKWQK